MRVLIFTQYFWPESFRINEIATGLLRQGVQVDVLTGKPNYPEGTFFKGYGALGFRDEMYGNVRVYRLPMLPRKNGSKLNLIFNYISFFISALIFAPWVLRSKKYDRIFVFGVSPIFQVIPASFLGWLKNAKVILWVQDLWPESVEATGHIKSKFFLAILKSMVRFSYFCSDFILVQSEAFSKHILNLAPNKPIKYYPNSVDSFFYNPKVSFCPSVKSLEDGFSVLFAGNVGNAQAVETIADACELLRSYPEIKIVILGSGSKSQWLEEQKKIRALSNLHLEGRYPFETMPLLMRKASILLVCLTNKPIFNLTIPSKLQAYLAIGRPIIASLNGEGANLINFSKAGIATPAEDSKELASAIIKLYKMTDEQRRIMGVSARRYFKKHFDNKMLLDDLVKILNDI